MNFEEYIKDIVTAEKVLIEDSEGFEEAEDYERLIRELLLLSNDELILSKCKVKDGAGLEIKINDLSFNVKLDLDEGLDFKNLVKGLNRFLKKKGSLEKFFVFWAADCFGQEVGFFLSDEAVGLKIFDYVEKHNQKVGHYIEQYQITDGKIEVGYDDLEA